MRKVKIIESEEIGMKDIIEGLNLIKLRLVELEKFDEAKIVKDLVERLENPDVINVSNNRRQINISSGNGTINAKQRNVINNSPLTVGDNNNQTINYSTRKGFAFDWD
jgi:hypothetical protein